MDEYKTTQANAEGVEKDNLPPANIMVAGITGTGKSTLLNAVFGSELITLFSIYLCGISRTRVFHIWIFPLWILKMPPR